MNEAVAAYRGVTAQDKFKHLQLMRGLARHDEAQALANARRQRDQHWQAVMTEAIADKEATIADREATISQQHTALADRDAALADREAYIAELLKLLNK